MQHTEFRVAARDGTAIFVRSFAPAQPSTETPRAIVLIAHGMAEHSARYARLAEVLTSHRYCVYASDHRGHGHTAAGPADLGHFADDNGFRTVVSDLHEVLDAVRARHRGLPVFLLGHSMGSYISRGLAYRWGDSLSGLMLSGTTHDHPLAYQGLRLTIVAAERARLGKRGHSPVIARLTFEAFNQTFAPNRTACDWLSRDAAEVDRYIDDPLCGFPCTTQLWWDVLGGMASMCKPQNLRRMPRALPIYVMAGACDPVNNKLAGIRKLQAAFEAAGLESVTCRVYPEARHELFNESNRNEITADLVAWLGAQLT